MTLKIWWSLRGAQRQTVADRAEERLLLGDEPSLTRASLARRLGVSWAGVSRVLGPAPLATRPEPLDR